MKGADGNRIKLGHHVVSTDGIAGRVHARTSTGDLLVVTSDGERIVRPAKEWRAVKRKTRRQ